MEDFEKEAINTALYWNEEGFNKRNREIFIEYMHFPNIRLWENQFFGKCELLHLKCTW